MIPKTKKLFISYRSSDHREVDYIAEQLRLLKYDDGISKFITWQDKHDLKGGKSWWDGIIDAIIDCDMFVFHLSPDYLASKVCMAELNYAIERGRPIIPVVLESAYYISPRTKNPELEFWDDVPKWIGKNQLIFYDEGDFVKRFEEAVTEYEQAWPRDISIRRPLNPDADSLHGTNYEVYATAIDYAQKVAFEDAKPLFRELVQRNDEDFADICRQWLSLIDRYQDLLDAKQHRAPRMVFKRKWEAYTAQFPLDFVDDLYPDIEDEKVIFDPQNFAKKPFWYKKKMQAKQEVAIKTTSSGSVIAKPKFTLPDLHWIEIPGGKGTLKTDEASVTLSIPTETYWIAKYPVTNLQFAKFIEAGGYKDDKWWTEEGWQKCQEGWHYVGGWKASGTAWTEPRYWQDSKWNGDTQPVVGVSWYELVAFCLWLSETTGEKIMLPTEAQWQYAAQGDDGKDYPWGNDWNRDLCNNNVDKKGIGKTTAVTQYEGKGDSAFGVVDMAGNVWEWCLTDYDNKTNDINSNANSRVLRGGSGGNSNADNFRCDYRNYGNPRGRYDNYGFRVFSPQSVS